VNPTNSQSKDAPIEREHPKCNIKNTTANITKRPIIGAYDKSEDRSGRKSDYTHKIKKVAANNNAKRVIIKTIVRLNYKANLILLSSFLSGLHFHRSFNC
jgi:hypothetical protein